MTIEKEEPGVLVAYCDRCGDRVVMDADPNSETAMEDAIEEMENGGWRIEAPDVVKFPGEAGVRKIKQEFSNHYCGDC